MAVLTIILYDPIFNFNRNGNQLTSVHAESRKSCPIVLVDKAKDSRRNKKVHLSNLDVLYGIFHPGRGLPYKNDGCARRTF